MSSYNNFPDAKHNLICHRKSPLVHSSLPSFSSQYCSIKCEGTVTTEKVKSISKRMIQNTNITRVNADREQAECYGFLMLLHLIPERATASLTKHTPYWLWCSPFLHRNPFNILLGISTNLCRRTTHTEQLLSQYSHYFFFHLPVSTRHCI